ncbi:hypothetical protein RYX36_015463 [Vicia faba]
MRSFWRKSHSHTLQHLNTIRRNYNLRQSHDFSSQVQRTSQTTPKPQILDIVKCTNSISTHMCNGHCHLALSVFDAMPYKNFFSRNLMLTGCVKNCTLRDARDLFDLMPHNVVWLCPGA